MECGLHLISVARKNQSVSPTNSSELSLGAWRVLEFLMFRKAKKFRL